MISNMHIPICFHFFLSLLCVSYLSVSFTFFSARVSVLIYFEYVHHVSTTEYLGNRLRCDNQRRKKRPQQALLNPSGKMTSPNARQHSEGRAARIYAVVLFRRYAISGRGKRNGERNPVVCYISKETPDTTGRPFTSSIFIAPRVHPLFQQRHVKGSLVQDYLP